MTWTYGNDLDGMSKILAHAAEHGVESIEAEYNPDPKNSCWSAHDAHVHYGNFTAGPISACRYRIKRKPREWWITLTEEGAIDCSWYTPKGCRTEGLVHVREVMDDE